MDKQVEKLLTDLREAVVLEREVELSHRLLREEMVTSSFSDRLDEMIGESVRHRKMVNNLLRMFKQR